MMKAIFTTVPVWMAVAIAPVMAQQGPIPLLPAPTATAPAPALVAPTLAAPSPDTAQSGAAGDTVSLRTTTESLEYCKHLSGRVDGLMRDAKLGSIEQVRSLSEEGERLCRHGQTRNGIYHLRRAFVILSKSELEH